MKISYFFDISVVIGRSDMKQKAKNVLRPMHSFSFIFLLLIGLLINLYLYSKKNSKCPFLLTYIRKNFSELSNIRTHIHPYTKASFARKSSL